jgi:glycosyltransferase involved in cell wall biosynthesis
MPSVTNWVSLVLMHVLFVAYRFPPQTGVGVLRPLKFAKYLSRLGVRVTVLSTEPPAGKKLDESLLEELPSDVKVIRVYEKRAIPPLTRTGLRKRFQVAYRWALSQRVVPDAQAGFIRPALSAASNITCARFDVVLATAPPWSAFVVAEKLSTQFRLPLVLDYRDPWTRGFPELPRKMGLLGRIYNPRLERRIVSRASAVISAHETIPGIIETELGLTGLASRSHWIPNGFDPEDFEGISPTRSSKFVVTYAGSIHGTRTLRPVVAALEELVTSGRVHRDDVLFRILGPSKVRLQPELTGSQIHDLVEAPGLVPHREALAALMGSTLNLSLDISYSGPKDHTPAKLYEYLSAGRPILAISREGLGPALIREAQGGWTVSPEDRHGLANVLEKAYRDWRHGRALPSPHPDVVARFNRAAQAARLAEILHACISRSR